MALRSSLLALRSSRLHCDLPYYAEKKFLVLKSTRDNRQTTAQIFQSDRPHNNITPTMLGLNAARRAGLLGSLRTFASLSRPAPFNPMASAIRPSLLHPTPVTGSGGVFGSVMGLMQRRFKTRGNTYQPSTLKRKRTFGFLARLRTKGGKKVLDRRRTKGRWYLSH